MNEFSVPRSVNQKKLYKFIIYLICNIRHMLITNVSYISIYTDFFYADHI